MKRWALFLSGRGSTATAAMDMLDEVDIRLVVSNKVTAYGLKKAKRLGVPSLLVGQGADKKIHWEKLDEELRNRGVNAIFLLGFMRLVPESFLKNWQGRIWNIHPSLLPAFPGAKALERAIESRSDLGATIHDVIVEMDAGKVCLQKKLNWDHDLAAELYEHPQTGFSALEQTLVRKFIMKQSLRGDLA